MWRKFNWKNLAPISCQRKISTNLKMVIFTFLTANDDNLKKKCQFKTNVKSNFRVYNKIIEKWILYHNIRYCHQQISWGNWPAQQLRDGLHPKNIMVCVYGDIFMELGTVRW